MALSRRTDFGHLVQQIFFFYTTGVSDWYAAWC